MRIPVRSFLGFIFIFGESGIAQALNIAVPLEEQGNLTEKLELFP